MAQCNIAIITLDSLRFDVAIESYTPSFNKLIQKYQKEGDNWHEVYSQATYTLPSHVSMFTGGMFPCNRGSIAPYDRRTSMFGYEFNDRTPLFEINKIATSVPNHFHTNGYQVIGIGGVKWFGKNTETTRKFWDYYFNEYYHEKHFNEMNSESFEHQIQLTSEKINSDKPLFYFLNVSSTHFPYRLNDRVIDSQRRALGYVDDHIDELIAVLPKPINVLICSDHGECFQKEDGCTGHGFYHPSVMKVPMCYLEIV